MTRVRRPVIAAALAVLGALASVSLGGCAVDFVLFNGEPLEAYAHDDYAGEMLDREALESLGPLPAGTIREVEFASGGERLSAVLLAPPGVEVGAGDTLLVYFHGSAEHLDYYWARVRLLYATGYATLAVDYRGYGTSTGSTDVPSLLVDAASTLDYVERELGGPAVVIYGNSIGSLAAARMGAERGPAALVLEVPPNSLETMVADQFGTNVPPETLFTEDVSVRVDTAATPAPLLLFAAEEDTVFPPARHAEPVFSLYEAERPGLGQRRRVPGGHDDVPSSLGYDSYVEVVRTFVAAARP